MLKFEKHSTKLYCSSKLAPNLRSMKQHVFGFPSRLISAVVRMGSFYSMSAHLGSGLTGQPPSAMLLVLRQRREKNGGSHAGVHGAKLTHTTSTNH